MTQPVAPMGKNRIGMVALTGIYLEEFAHADGFACYADMWAFFSRRANNEGEFHGKLIKW